MRYGPAALAALAVWLGGCAAIPTAGPGGTTTGAGTTVPDPGGAAPGAGGAVSAPDPARTDSDADGAGASLPERSPAADAMAALVTQSRDQRVAGDFAAAAETIERALTIAPDDAGLWVELAEIRLDQGNPALAGEMARKALTLTSENSALAARARRLIGL